MSGHTVWLVPSRTQELQEYNYVEASIEYATITKRLHSVQRLQAHFRKILGAIFMTEDRQDIEQYHRMLIERLDKPEQKLVLRIIDAGDRIANELSLDSFICGFLLAWEMLDELNHYQDERPVLENLSEPGASAYPDEA